MSDGSIESRSAWAPILALAALGFAVRAATVFLAPNIAGADEIFQTTEQAYRLLTGRGFIPWEFYYGVRSWIFPGLLAGVIRLCWTLGLGSIAAFQAIRLVMAAISLPTIACAYLWGRRSALPGAPVICGILAALWPDMVYFSVHPLNEVLAAALLVPGIFLAEPVPGAKAGRGRVFVAAFLLSWAAVLRIQLAPAAFVAWLWAVWPDRRRFLAPAFVAGALPVLVATAVDWATWGRPLQSIWLNAIVNTSYGVAASFGTAPFFAYFVKLDVMWGGATAFVALAALVAVPRARLVAAAAAAVFIAHMAVAHKEYRFIFPAIPLVLALAGIGTARIVQLIAAGLAQPAAGLRLRLACFATALWVVTCASVALSREYLELFRQHAGAIEASFDIARDPDVCGVALWGINWTHWSGEFSLGHDVPVYYPDTDAQFLDRAPGFNRVLYRKGKDLPGDGWTTERCRPMNAALPRALMREEPDYMLCIAKRAGSCTAEPPLYPPLYVPGQLRSKPFPWLTQALPGDGR